MKSIRGVCMRGAKFKGVGFGIVKFGNQTRRAISWASPRSGRIVRVRVVPHWTQLCVTSSRSLDSAPLANRVGATPVIDTKLRKDVSVVSGNHQLSLIRFNEAAARSCGNTKRAYV